MTSWCKRIINKTLEFRRNITSAHDAIDCNIERNQLELGENLSDQELRAMIEEFDQDGDGALNLEEFMALMTKEI
ncbi:Centrin-3 [Schistosoma japonicum]|nr:Centrin-3 [Schistosoma japonicum]